jgi:signal transduction histidine kinase
MRTEELMEANNELITQNNLIENQKQQIEKNQGLLEIKVKERTKDLELAKQKAVESDKLKSSFLGNISHEIRTPLNAIIGFSSIVVDMAHENPEIVKYTTHIYNSAELLLKIINDILDLSKIETEQLIITKTAINLNNLLNTLYTTFHQQINEKYSSNVKLRINNSLQKGKELIIYTDLPRLQQVFFHLMDNAMKFTKSGFIELGYEIKPGAIMFYIKDSGIGINAINLKRIFERFVKVEEKDILYKGSGLGLSLSKSLIELLGGKIWVESVENQGSTFYFTIPDEHSYTIDSKVDL